MEFIGIAGNLIVGSVGVNGILGVAIIAVAIERAI